ncbi:MAG: EamA family transporter [Candidatus Nanopelagicales bacterium]|jgi:DME family drug/metabolite transporter
MSVTVATPTERRTASVAVLGSAALFGTSGTARVLLQPDAPAAGAAAARLIVGAAGLVAWASRTPEGRQALLRLWRRPIIWAMGVTVAAYQIFFFLAMSRTGVAVGTLASLALAPFMAGILGWIMREGAPGYVWLASTVLAITGVSLLTVGAGDSRDVLGIAFGLAAGASYAFFTVFGVRFAREGEQPTHVLAASFAVSGVLLIPVFLMSGSWWMSWSSMALILWLGLATTTLAYVLFGIGLRSLQPGHIATLNLAEPVFATLLGVFVLGEALGGLGVLGCLLVIVGLGVLGVAEGRSTT